MNSTINYSIQNINDTFKRKFGYFPFENISEILLNESQIDMRITQFLEKLASVNLDVFCNPTFDKEEFSVIMSMSQSTLHRKMCSILQLTPMRFVRSIQYARTLDLLTNSNYNVSKLAQKAGFTDSKYFSKCFRNEFGLRILEVRKMLLSSNTEMCIASTSSDKSALHFHKSTFKLSMQLSY